MFDHNFLSREHLEGFDSYKYMAIDTSPLSVYVMHPFWNKIVEIIPKWVAPNVLTFVGFLLTVLNFVLLSYYDYDYSAASTVVNATGGVTNGHAGHIPTSLWYYMAVFLFLAYTLDGIDGKQARRTGTSGPLGEMFDHGLDSYSVFFIPACLYSIFGRADYSVPPIRMYYIIWNVLLNFYISHWEKYNTGVLFLPWGYDLSMWSSSLIFIWTGLNGTTFFKRDVFGNFTLANVFEVTICMAGVGTNLPISLYNVYKSYELGTGKGRPFLEAVRPLWPLLSVFTILTVWVHRSPNDICEYDPRTLFLLVGTTFSYITCRLIVAQMSSTRCEVSNPVIYMLFGMCAISLSTPAMEISALYIATGLVLASHIHYGTCVVRQMCNHFKISCFVIKDRTD